MLLPDCVISGIQRIGIAGSALVALVGRRRFPSDHKRGRVAFFAKGLLELVDGYNGYRGRLGRSLKRRNFRLALL
jgi:hypothetical protein